jgi:hypothetical protein
MSTLLNELLINFLESGYGNLFTFVETTDFVILAETAVQIAPAEKDGATAFGATDARFFPHMQSSSGYDGKHAATTRAITTSGSGNTFGSLNTASVRANITFGHRNIPFFSQGQSHAILNWINTFFYYCNTILRKMKNGTEKICVI